MKTFTLAANTLAVDEDALYIRAGGSTAANANVKTIRIKIGGTEIILHTLFITAPNGLVWDIVGNLVRTAAGSSRTMFTFYFTNATTGAVLGVSFENTIAVDFTTDLAIIVTGENGVSTLNDIQSTSLFVSKIARQS